MSQPRDVRLRSVQLRNRVADAPSFKLCVRLLGAGLAIAVGLLMSVEGAPPLIPLLLLAALVVAAENRDRLYGDETSVSGSIAVGTAAVFVFSESTPLLGPLVIASCAAIYWPHIRDRQVAKMIVNAASIGLSALAGALVFRLAPPLEALSLLEVLMWTAPVVVAYWLVNSCVLSIASTCLRGGTFRSASTTLLWSEKNLLVFAIAGGLAGALYEREGTAVGIAALVLILIAFDTLVISEQYFGRAFRRGAFGRAVVAYVPAVGASVAYWALVPGVGPPIAAVSAAITAVTAATLIALLRFRWAAGTWELALAFGAAIADLPLVIVAVIGGVVAEVFGVAVALAFVAVALVVGRVVSEALRRRRDRVSPSDEDLLEAVELALMDRRYTAPNAR